MAILVSGASGFLGSRLVERLAANGQDVVAISRRPAHGLLGSNPRVRWVLLDIEKEGLPLNGLPDIEAVVHLAGATLGAGKDENKFLRSNEQTTVRLLQALAEHTDRFVFASSQVVYGDACHLRVDEDFPLQPIGSAYACSKINSENWLRWFQTRYGGQYLALRFCGFIDGGGLVDYLIDQALTGAPINLHSKGMVRRDYLSSANGIDALLAALNFRGQPGFMPVNIGSGQSVSAHEMARHVCTKLRSSSQIVLNTSSAPQGDFVFCIERAQQLLNFQPSNLIEAVQCYAEHRQSQAQKRSNDE
jgi:nucleoside-diphosphate-sugar epimerase